MEKTIGIKVVASIVFCIGCGISGVILYGITHRDIITSWVPQTSVGIFDTAARIGIILPLEAAMAFILSGGLWTMQDWARRGVIGGSLYVLVKTIFQIMRATSSLAFLPQSRLDVIFGAECTLLIPIIIYLQLPRVRSSFKVSSE